MTDNKTYLAYRRGFDHRWSLYIKPIGPTDKDRNRAFKVAEEMLESFSGMMRPTVITYTAYESENLDSIVSRNTEDITALDGEIANDAGITADEFSRKCRRDLEGRISDPYWVLKSAHVADGQVRVRLADGDYWIDKDSELFEVDIPGWPRYPPIETRFFNNFYSSGARYCGVGVNSSRTDIWFEETEVGEVNRRRLAKALWALAEAIDVTDVEIDSDKWGMAALERFFPELAVKPSSE